MKELTVKEYADRERVHEETVRRWIGKGAVPIRRTPGGGIRIASEAGQHLPASTHNRPHSSE